MIIILSQHKLHSSRLTSLKNPSATKNITQQVEPPKNECKTIRFEFETKFYQ